MFSDLECDYINPIDLCNRLNQVRDHNVSPPFKLYNLPSNSLFSRRTVPTYFLPCSSSCLDSGLPCCSMRLWLPLIAISNRNVPCHLSFILTPVTYRIVNKDHMYDATEIFRMLQNHKKESFIKLGFYLLSFFYYLYRYVSMISLR